MRNALAETETCGGVGGGDAKGGVEGSSSLMRTFDILIVGAGIAGASIASELARSRRVCLIEAETTGSVHATGRSAALFAPTYGGPEIRALTRASRSFFDKPPSGFADHPLLNERGCLYLAREDQLDRLTAMADAIRASGGRTTLLETVQALRLVPLLHNDYVAKAALDSEAMDIDVDALHQGFVRSARAAGAVMIMASPVLDVERRDGMWHVASAEDAVRAPIIVNAAGAWADQVGTLCGAAVIGFQALRRTACLVDPPSGCSILGWPAVIDVDEQFYFKPDAGKLLLSPADESLVEPCDVQPEELDIAIGVDRVQASLAIEVRRVTHSWAGLRTFAPDRVPVVGYDPVVEGLFWCAGQGGYGIQTAPALARMAACLVLDEDVPPDVAAEELAAADLSPRRFERISEGKAHRT